MPAFSVALVLPSLYYIEAEVESGCYCNEDTMCSIQPLLGACKKFCSHTTTTTTSSEYLLCLLQAGWVFNLLEILWDTPKILQKSAVNYTHPLIMSFRTDSFLTFLVTIFKNIRSNFFSAIFKTTTWKLNRKCTLSEMLSIWSAIRTNFFNIK